MKATIYVDREDYKTVEDEEKNNFIRGVLEEMGLPVEEVWQSKILSVDEKIELRKLLGKYDVFIAGKNGDIEIYVQNELVAQWRKPRYRLIVDRREIDPAKRTYLEMSIDCSSVFDEDDDWQEKEGEE